MTVRCPKCMKALRLEDVNLQANLARCPDCNEAFALSELAQERGPDAIESLLGPPPPVDLNHPPPGVTYEQTFDGVIVKAPTRSCIVIFLIPFMCFWSGGALGGILSSQIKKGKFDLAMSLFALPFLLITIGMAYYCLMCIFGRVEVRISGDDGAIFTGVGPLGWTRRFQLSDVIAVREKTSRSSKGGVTKYIQIEAEKTFQFGSMLNDARRHFLMQVLKKATGK